MKLEITLDCADLEHVARVVNLVELAILHLRGLVVSDWLDDGPQRHPIKIEVNGRPKTIGHITVKE